VGYRRASIGFLRLPDNSDHAPLKIAGVPLHSAPAAEEL